MRSHATLRLVLLFFLKDIDVQGLEGLKTGLNEDSLLIQSPISNVLGFKTGLNKELF